MPIFNILLSSVMNFVVEESSSLPPLLELTRNITMIAERSLICSSLSSSLASHLRQSSPLEICAFVLKNAIQEHKQQRSITAIEDVACKKVLNLLTNKISEQCSVLPLSTSSETSDEMISFLYSTYGQQIDIALAQIASETESVTSIKQTPAQPSFSPLMTSLSARKRTASSDMEEAGPSSAKRPLPVAFPKPLTATTISLISTQEPEIISSSDEEDEADLSSEQAALPIPPDASSKRRVVKKKKISVNKFSTPCEPSVLKLSPEQILTSSSKELFALLSWPPQIPEKWHPSLFIHACYHGEGTSFSINVNTYKHLFSTLTVNRRYIYLLQTLEKCCANLSRLNINSETFDICLPTPYALHMHNYFKLLFVTKVIYSQLTILFTPIQRAKYAKIKVILRKIEKECCLVLGKRHLSDEFILSQEELDAYSQTYPNDLDALSNLCDHPF